ncbi:uncharacterized protein LOC143661907 isoform X2 [Tamandua tetradactyla]|uniref:uncharacterized protein LOC143661907 isoform X2 n=1 Tax=Tamandua tetradactyla TaxID=48850 RepID=UPI004053E4C3
MKGFADFAPRPGGPPQEPREPQPGWTLLQGDVDMGSSVNRSDTHENGSAGRTSQGSDSSDSAKELCGCQRHQQSNLGLRHDSQQPSPVEFIQTLLQNHRLHSLPCGFWTLHSHSHVYRESKTKLWRVRKASSPKPKR